MAVPVVTAVTFTPDPGTPGTTVNAVVTAADPDPTEYNGVARSTDAGGNVGPDFAFLLSVPNPLAYELEFDAAAVTAGVTVVADPTVEGGFFVSLPS